MKEVAGAGWMDDVKKKIERQKSASSFTNNAKLANSKKQLKQSEVITPDLKKLVDPSVLLFVVALPPPDQASYVFILRSAARVVPILKQSSPSYYVPLSLIMSLK
jgi:hypothetical protein